jgi:hypothetical protein
MVMNCHNVMDGDELSHSDGWVDVQPVHFDTKIQSGHSEMEDVVVGGHLVGTEMSQGDSTDRCFSKELPQKLFSLR